MLNAKILDTRKARLCKTLDLYRIVEYITYITFSQIDTLEILALKIPADTKQNVIAKKQRILKETASANYTITSTPPDPLVILF